MSRKNKRGFTLAELLIVVAIIAILAAIAIPVFNSRLEKAREAVCMSNRRSLLGEMRTEQMLDAALCEREAAQALFASFQYECPSGGKLTASYDDAGFLLAVSCSLHGQSDFDKALVIASGIGENKGDYGYIKEYVALAEAAGGLITIDKDDLLAEYFKDGPSDIHHSISSDENPIVWCGMQYKYNGQWQQMLVATQKSNVVRAGNPLLNGYVIYYNGSYYCSAKRISGKLDECSLRGSYSDGASYEQWLINNGWVKFTQ